MSDHNFPELSATSSQSVVLAATHHDPDGAMLPQLRRILPVLRKLYSAIVVLASSATEQRTIELLRDHDAHVVHDASAEQGADTLGLKRLELLRVTASQHSSAHIHLCDLDRALHWAEQYPDELRTIISAIPRHDLLILGRTARAFATHARVQRDTEQIVNHVFGLAFGQPLDVTAASRGLSPQAAEALLALDTHEPTAGQDCSWPLYLARLDELVIGYAATEGLEWETPDRFGDEIAAAGGLEVWLAEYDAEPHRWQERTRLALYEVAAINRWR